MSLINKMLQDLDARGNARGADLPSEIKPVAPGGGRSPALRIAAITGGFLVLVLGATAWYVLPLKGKTYDVQPAAPVAQVTPPAVPAAPATAPSPVTAAATPPAAEDAAAPASAAGEAAAATADATPVETVAPPRRQAAARPRSDAGSTRPARQARADAAIASARDAGGEADPGQGRIETAGQATENAYRRALANLNEGRVSEAIAGLQAVLRSNPKHDAARQTLVGLLVEGKREDEAMAQLQQALTLDARQPAMAMLLARLQIERGKSGIETLLRTLPYASGNGDYHAFLGGALHRQARFREAAEQYTNALRTAPDNAVWWMGLGLALQEDKRNAEALDALRQAKALGTLSPELQSFVERKLAR